MMRRSDQDLQRYFDGELSLRKAKGVQQQIAADEADQIKLEALEGMRALVRESVDGSAEEADFSLLWTSIAQGIAEHERARPSPFSHWLFRWGMVSVSAVAAIVLAVLLWNPVGGPPSNDCVIETIEVAPGATSTIFTIADPELADATTVLWVDDSQEEK